MPEITSSVVIPKACSKSGPIEANAGRGIPKNSVLRKSLTSAAVSNPIDSAGAIPAPEPAAPAAAPASAAAPAAVSPEPPSRGFAINSSKRYKPMKTGIMISGGIHPIAGRYLYSSKSACFFFWYSRISSVSVTSAYSLSSACIRGRISAPMRPERAEYQVSGAMSPRTVTMRNGMEISQDMESSSPKTF